MCAMSGHRWCCTIQNTRRRFRWRRNRDAEGVSFRGAAEADIVEVILSAPVADRRVDADRSAPGRHEIQAGKAEQDRRSPAIVERMKHRLARLEHMAEEISERHFTRQDEGR